MLRTPDGLIEKVSIQEKVLDCAPYMSRSGLTFNGCLLGRRGELLPVRGLFKLYDEPLYRFGSRGKITRDFNRMKDLVGRFLREFSIDNGLIYYDNYFIHIYDGYRKAVMLEDTPYYSQGHLYVYRLRISIDLDQETREESLFNHKIIFENPVNIYYQLHDDIHIRPGVGFVVQTDDVSVKITSPDHGEEEITLPTGQWLFLHSPPRKNAD